MKVLSPNQRNRDSEAIMVSGGSVRVRVVGGIGELIRLVFAEESIILASLREGFFNISGIADQFNNPIDGVISFLTCDNQRRFWDILDRHFLAGHCKVGKELLDAFVRFHLKEKLYPTDFGAGLFQLICSLPPVIRKQKMVKVMKKQKRKRKKNLINRETKKNHINGMRKKIQINAF